MFGEYVSIIGLVMLIIAWIPETVQNWRERGRNLNLKFVLLYLFGSLFLAYHAVIIRDPIFTYLNVLATLIALLNAVVILTRTKTKGKKAKKKGKRR
jgi:MtN3 and saliva related transmembrane protein